MNYLAHAYLSFKKPEILVGNMISDHVKGKKQFDYEPAIQKGIKLHRAIDAFTDAHTITKQAKQYLYPAVGAYSGAFIDVVYDHFLALDTTQFTNDSALQKLSTDTYKTLFDFENILPEKFAVMLPYMQQHNWLYNYQYVSGIQKSFEGVARRAKYLSSSQSCFELFKEHYSVLQDCYSSFFPFVKKMSIEFLEADNDLHAPIYL